MVIGRQFVCSILYEWSHCPTRQKDSELIPRLVSCKVMAYPEIINANVKYFNQPLINWRVWTSIIDQDMCLQPEWWNRAVSRLVQPWYSSTSLPSATFLSHTLFNKNYKQRLCPNITCTNWVVSLKIFALPHYYNSYEWVASDASTPKRCRCIWRRLNRGKEQTDSNSRFQMTLGDSTCHSMSMTLMKEPAVSPVHDNSRSS